MKVQILSKKLITPSFPTPNHLQNMKISSMDQLAPPVYIGVLFFYPSSSGNDKAKNTERSKKLQESLSETLSVFYPFAGRYIKENVMIDCNDQGVEYLEAQVSCQLSLLLNPPGELDFKLWSYCLSYMAESATSPLIAVQFNMFECGGTAIGIYISHRIADGFTICNFIKEWATACKEGIDKVSRPSFNLASLFPSREIPLVKSVPRVKEGAKMVSKMFVFNGAAISKLRELAIAGAKNTTGVLKYQPSRVEVVTAVIWKTLIKVRQVTHGQLRPSVLSHSINLRGKTGVPIPENTYGNVYRRAIARFMPTNESKTELHDLVGLIHAAIQNTIKDCTQQQNSDSVLLGTINASKEFNEDCDNDDIDVYGFTSWCRFPTYEVDFGWGKPSVVGSGFNLPVVIIALFDAKDGAGIEAYINLEEKDMLLFLQNPDIIEFTTFPKQSSITQ